MVYVPGSTCPLWTDMICTMRSEKFSSWIASKTLYVILDRRTNRMSLVRSRWTSQGNAVNSLQNSPTITRQERGFGLCKVMAWVYMVCKSNCTSLNSFLIFHFADLMASDRESRKLFSLNTIPTLSLYVLNKIRIRNNSLKTIFW